jgi:hypothetical protein
MGVKLSLPFTDNHMSLSDEFQNNNRCRKLQAYLYLKCLLNIKQNITQELQIDEIVLFIVIFQ